MKEKIRLEQLKIENQFKLEAGILDLCSSEKLDSDVIGQQKAKKDLHHTIIVPIKFPQLSMHFRYKWHSGILLYGPKGCGKTHILKCVANEVKMKFVYIEAEDLLEPETGLSFLKSTFCLARHHRTCIILISNSELLTTELGKSLIPELLVEIQLCYMEDYKISVVYETCEPWKFISSDSLLKSCTVKVNKWFQVIML